MKKNIFVSKSIKKQKKVYYFLVGLALIGIITGLLFIFLISDDNRILINSKIKDFFGNDVSILDNFFKCLFNNYVILLLIWILGISIIGIPFVIIILLFKSFIYGFSISSLLSTFGFKGILVSLFYVMISKSVYLVVLILICFYSISFSFKLIKSFLFNGNIDFKDSIKKYIRVLLISLVVCLLISIYEGLISFNILKLFE